MVYNVYQGFSNITIDFGEGFGLYARYLCSRDALGLKADHSAGRPSAATGYRVYKGLAVDYVLTNFHFYPLE